MNWSKYLFNDTSSVRSRERKAAQNNSRKRQSSSHSALLCEGVSALPYLMVRSMSSCARAKAPSARWSLPAFKAFSTRDVSLPMLAICCGKVNSAQRPFSNVVCCILSDNELCYNIFNRFPCLRVGNPTGRIALPGADVDERVVLDEILSRLSSPAEPFSNSRRSKSACSSASRANSPRFTSATLLIMSPNVFSAKAASSARVMAV